jgi:hypothetical protein
VPPLRLVFDPDPIGDARHVVEVADDLDGVRDRCVVEALCTERVDVGLVDLRREMRQLDREVAERTLARREVGPPVVVLRVLCDLVCALCTEVVCVCDRSVVAALLGRRDRREQLALAA